MGEGAAVLVLEREGAARARGARMLGTLRGYGASADANHMTAPSEDGSGQAAAMTAALADAGVRRGRGRLRQRPRHLDAAQRPRRDGRAEGARSASARASIPISSTKSAIGHLLGAAGAVEAVATILALRERVVPPTLGFSSSATEGLDLDYVPDSARPLELPDGEAPLAISNSFGFGGHNAVLCLEAT